MKKLKETLEIALAKAKQNLKVTRDVDEDDKQKIISDITDPTPGAVVKDYFDDDNNQFITSTDKPLKLNDYDKKNPLITTKIEGSSEIKPLNFTDEMTAVKNVSEIDFEDEPTKTTVDVVPPDYTYYPNNPPDVVLMDDDEFEKTKNEPEDFSRDNDDIMIQLPEDETDGDKFTTIPSKTEIKTEVFDDGQKLIQKKVLSKEKIKIKSGSGKKLKKKKNRKNPYLKKKKVTLTDRPYLPTGIPKPYAKVIPRQAQLPSVLFNKLVNEQNDVQMSNTQETDNEVIQNPVPQAQHPAIAFRQITTTQRNESELKRKLSSIKNVVESLGESINNEIKETIVQTEKNKSDSNIKIRIKSIKDKIDQLKQLNAHIDLKPIDDAVQYLKTTPAHPRV